MEKNKLRIYVTFWGLFCLVSLVHAEKLDLYIETAGTLGQLLGNQKETVTELRLRGHLNSDDITCLQEMPILRVLDVEETDVATFPFAHSGIVSIILPKTVKKLSALSSCKKLETVVLPEGLTSLGTLTFYECSSLKSINIPEGITSIPYYVFSGCSSLKTIELPQSLTEIGESAFNRSGIEAITIPAGVLSIGDRAFANCWVLKSVVLPEGVTDIGQEAFNRTGLKSICIPGSVTSLGHKAVGECYDLDVIYVSEGMGRIREGAFEGSTPCCLVWNRTDNIPSSLFEYYSTPPSHKNFLVYVKSDITVPENWNTAQVIYDGMAESIVISDETGFERFYAALPFKVKKISYSRNFDVQSGLHFSAGWQSVVLPFTASRFMHEVKGELAPFGSNVTGTKPFWLRELTPDGYVVSSTLQANRPYIISMPNNAEYEDEYNITGTVTFIAENTSGVEVSATPAVMPTGENANYKLVPTYQMIAANDTVYALNSSVYNKKPGGSVFVKALRNVLPFEAYVVSKESHVTAPAMYSIGGDGGSSTALEKILLKEDNSLRIHTQGSILYIETDKPRLISIYGVDGILNRSVNVHEGENTINDLPAGIYFLEGKKVIIRN